MDDKDIQTKLHKIGITINGEFLVLEKKLGINETRVQLEKV